MPDLHVSCSPDADDLFMMWALTEGHLDTGGWTVHVDTSPTDDLNRLASGESPPDVAALSIAHYPAVAHRYQLLPHGGSMGEGYGPVVVAPQPMTLDALRQARIAVPGLTTTAWMTLQLILGPQARSTPVVTPIVPYRRIFDALNAGEVDAGLIIHEGRLTFEDEGMHRVLDVGQWWAQDTRGLPLPLGANTIRRDLPEAHIARISHLLRESIRYALDHRDEAIAWLLARGGALRSAERIDRYLDMYANRRTLDYGAEGRASIQTFFTRAVAAGLLPECPPLDYAP